MKIERHVKLAATVDTLQDSFAFVMAVMEEVGPHPSIEIQSIQQSAHWNPVTGEGAEDDSWVHRYTVTVHGSVEEDR